MTREALLVLSAGLFTGLVLHWFGVDFSVVAALAVAVALGARWLWLRRLIGYHEEVAVGLLLVAGLVWASPFLFKFFKGVLDKPSGHTEVILLARVLFFSVVPTIVVSLLYLCTIRWRISVYLSFDFLKIFGGALVCVVYSSIMIIIGFFNDELHYNIGYIFLCIGLILFSYWVFLGITPQAKSAFQLHSSAVRLVWRAERLRAHGKLVEADRLLESFKIPFSAPLLLSQAYECSGRIQLALANFGGARTLFRAAYDQAQKQDARDRVREAALLANIGTVSAHLGDWAAAEKVFLQAEDLERKTLGPRHPDLALTLVRLGTVERASKRHDAAARHLAEALNIQRRVLPRNNIEIAETLEQLGFLAQETGDFVTANSRFSEALAIRRLTPGDAKVSTGPALIGLAAAQAEQGDLEGAETNLEEALRVAVSPDGIALREPVYDAISAVQARYGRTDAAIFFGKQAVNAVQRQRASLTALEQALQRSFVVSREGVYRRLSDLLVSVGRLGEAQQVLAMLKEEELFDLLRRDADACARLTFAQLTTLEVEWKRHGDAVGADLVRLTTEIATLRCTAARSPEQEARLRAARVELDVAGQAFRAWLDLLRADLTGGTSHENHSAAVNLDLLERLQADLRALGPDVALVTYIVGAAKLSMIFTTSTVQVSRETSASEQVVNQLVHEFRMAIDQRLAGMLPLGQSLWRLLVGPIEALLTETGTKHLIIVPYGTLRYLPFAALHDGERYLVERFAVSLLTLAAHGALRDRSASDWRVAGFGVSREVPGYRQLASVQEELSGIVQTEPGGEGIYPGEISLDEAFTEERLANALETHEAVHIASHFVLNPAQGFSSHLLLGAGAPLTLDRLRDPSFDFRSVELITLSACETAVGGGSANGREFEGFGAMVQQRGAKAVIASLWAVADHSTALLMTAFYRERHSGLSKAVSLQRAQRALLGGLYAHPYYWAPFVLMGNWL